MRKLLLAVIVAITAVATPAAAEENICEVTESVYTKLCARVFAPTVGNEKDPKFQKKLVFAATMCTFSGQKLKRHCEAGAEGPGDSCRGIANFFQKYLDDACSRGVELTPEVTGLSRDARYGMCKVAYKDMGVAAFDLCKSVEEHDNSTKL